MTDRRRAERGSVSIVTAAAMVLAGVLALGAVDVTRVLQARAVAQTAADAAALAAAQSLAVPVGPSAADAAAEYTAANGAVLESCACGPGRTEAVVEVTVTVHLVLLGGARTVTGRARAVVAGEVAAAPQGPMVLTATTGSTRDPPPVRARSPRHWRAA